MANILAKKKKLVYDVEHVQPTHFQNETLRSSQFNIVHHKVVESRKREQETQHFSPLRYR